ncbi:arginase family protein [Leifsonia poae]|uniref:arginase family protein n=1 Tax=Leifsonia poae TaxID=110933 RepID=UPI003D66A634
MRPSIIVFAGKVGDHNDRAMAAAPLVGAEISRRLDTEPVLIGNRRPATNHGWAHELSDGEPELRALAAVVDESWSAGTRPVVIAGRNTVALATLPVLARRHPGAVMVWIGADTSLNTPSTTRTGYLGGMVLSAASGLWKTPLGDGLPLSHIVFCGTRDVEPVEHLLIESGLVAHVHQPGQPLTDLVDAIGGRSVFVHFACDALDPGIVPTDYSIAGGYTLEQAADLIAMLASHNVLGVEVTELEIPYRGADTTSVPVIVDLLEPLIR